MKANQQDKQQVSIETITANVVALHQAWSYFYLLQAIHQFGKNHSAVWQEFAQFLGQLYRAVFDALFSKVGTLIDRTRKKGTHSLPTLVTLGRKYGDAELRRILKQVDARLKADGPIAKLESWRHKVVAHRTTEGWQDEFYDKNKMTLQEVESGLTELQELLDQISLKVVGCEATMEAHSNLIGQGDALFNCIAKHASFPPAPPN